MVDTALIHFRLLVVIAFVALFGAATLAWRMAPLVGGTLLVLHWELIHTNVNG